MGVRKVGGSGGVLWGGEILIFESLKWLEIH